METLSNFMSSFNGLLWGWPLLILLFGTHIYLTFKLKFIQRFIFKGIKVSFQKDEGSSGDVSQFAALATSLAATLGTGNIVGVSTAIALGGPGAVFWVWLSGFLGIATKYSEGLLSVKYRVRTQDGTMAGGPMYVLENGLGKKWLGVLFAIFTALAGLGIGGMVQANSISTLVNENFNVPTWITGLIISVLVAGVILGGIKKIATICNVLVPFMALFYLLGCVVLLILGYDTVGSTVLLILRSAFTGQAAVGGFTGATLMMAMRFGVSRGLFSNESGLGSAPIVAAAAQTKNSVKQALVSATGPFWDTVIMCAITGIVIVNSGFWQEGLTGAALTNTVFSQIPVVGSLVLSIALAAFVFTTMVGWSYYAEKSMEYIFGKIAVLPYKLLFITVIFVGSIFSVTVVWDFADISNGLMAIPNLISLVLLSGVLVKETEKYLWSGNLEMESNDIIYDIKPKKNKNQKIDSSLNQAYEKV